MKFLKSKALWYAIYGIFITLVFLYLLFPSDIARDRLEQTAGESGFVLKSLSFGPSLPCGFRMKTVTLGSRTSANIYFQGDAVDLQFKPLSFFRNIKLIGLNGKAYGGRFSGRFGFDAFSRMYPPRSGNLVFANIDLGKYPFIRTLIGTEITGKATGKWVFSQSPTGNLSGTFALSLDKGSFALAEPFLGMNRIDFDRGELQATIENGRMTLEKLRISGEQLDCSLTGDIMLAGDFKNSRLNLKGDLSISDRKVKMNITIGGTLADPQLRYI